MVQNRFWRYSEASEKIMKIFHRFDPHMCPAGCDEGYLKYGYYISLFGPRITDRLISITAYCEEHSLTAEECVQQMRETVFKESQLTVSAGIAPNKVRILSRNLWNESNRSLQRCSQKYAYIFLCLRVILHSKLCHFKICSDKVRFVIWLRMPTSDKRGVE